MEETTKPGRISSLVSWAVFLTTLAIVLISLVPVIFPALILRTLGGFENVSGTNPYETGIWAWPLLIANIVVFGLAILYFKNKMPDIIKKPIRFIFDFEVSAQVAFLVIAIIIGVYIVLNVNQIYNGFYDDDYYERVQGWLENFHLTKPTDQESSYHVMVLFEVISMKVFASYKAVLFISNIALLIITYFITAEITKKRFAGIVALVLVLQSGVFLMYQTYVSYPNFWIMFYLLSLYLIYKKWPLSPVSYILSVLTKILTAVYIPLTLFVIYRSSIPRKKKIYSAITYLAILIIGVIILFATHTSITETKSFNSHKFWDGFTAAYTSFRYDGMILLFLLPLTVGLFYASRKGYLHAEWVMFLIMSMLISAPLVETFSDTINVPYRFIPIVIFFAIGVGVLLSKRSST
ncbi:MAG: hypothetical protein ACREAD_06350 [Nitrosopumilaceae archaeon]